MLTRLARSLSRLLPLTPSRAPAGRPRPFRCDLLPRVRGRNGTLRRPNDSSCDPVPPLTSLPANAAAMPRHVGRERGRRPAGGNRAHRLKATPSRQIAAATVASQPCQGRRGLLTGPQGPTGDKVRPSPSAQTRTHKHARAHTQAQTHMHQHTCNHTHTSAVNTHLQKFSNVMHNMKITHTCKISS